MFKLNTFKNPRPVDDVSPRWPRAVALSLAWLIWLAGVGGAGALLFVFAVFRWVCWGYGSCDFSFGAGDLWGMALLAAVGAVGGALVAGVQWLLLSRRRRSLIDVAARAAVAAAALPIAYLASVLLHLALAGHVSRSDMEVPEIVVAGIVGLALIAPTRP
jgi:hypothetical protein